MESVDTPFWDIYSNLPQDLQSDIAYDTNLYRVSRENYERSWLKRRKDNMNNRIRSYEILSSLNEGDNVCLLVSLDDEFYAVCNGGLHRSIYYDGTLLKTQDIDSTFLLHPRHLSITTTVSEDYITTPLRSDVVLVTSIPLILERRGWNYTVDEIAHYISFELAELNLDVMFDVKWLICSYYELGGGFSEDIQEKAYTEDELKQLARDIYDELPDLVLLWLVEHYQHRKYTPERCKSKLLTPSDYTQLFERPKERTAIIISDIMYLVSLSTKSLLASVDTHDNNFTIHEDKKITVDGRTISFVVNSQSQYFTKVVPAPTGIMFLLDPCYYTLYKNIMSIVDSLDEKFRLGYFMLCLHDLYDDNTVDSESEAEIRIRSLLDV